MYKFYHAVLAAALIIPASASAQWNTDSTPFTVAPISELREDQLQAAPLPDGKTIVSWVRQNDERTSADLYVQILDTEGNTTLGDFGKRINAHDGVSYSVAMPGMVVLDDGSTIFMFADPRNDDGTGKTMPYLYKVDADGNLLTSADGVALVSDTDRGRNFAMYKLGGNIFASFEGNNPGTYDNATRIYRINEADCSSLWDEPLIIDGSATMVPCDGGFITVSLNSNNLYAQKYSYDKAAQWSETVTVAESTAIWGVPAAYADGRNGAIVPYEFTDKETYQTCYPVAKVNADGTADSKWMASLAPVDGYMVSASRFAVTAAGDIFAFTNAKQGWGTPSGLYAASYNADGTMAASKLIDSAQLDCKLASVMQKDGDFVLVYNKQPDYSNTGIEARRISAAFDSIWGATVAVPASINGVAVAASENSFTTFFCEAPSGTEVGVKALRMFYDGSYAEPKVYDIDVTLTEPGTLSKLITETQMWDAMSLRVAGPINSDDVNIIRQMAGVKGYDQETNGWVKDINLADATIVAGGSPYCSYYSMDVWDYVDCTTTDNVFPPLFFRRTSIEHIDLPKNITAIGTQALYSCGALTSIVIPETVTSIETEAFGGSGITSVKLPAAVTSLGSYAFWGCANLADIDIQCQLTSIPEGMMSQTCITEFDIPETVTKIGSGAFKDCAYMETVTGAEGVESIGSYAFQNCLSLKNFKLGEKVNSIGIEAFGNDASLCNQTIPASTEYIGRRAFNNCASMTEYTVADDNAYYKAIDGLLYSKDGLNVIACPAGRMNAVIVADGVETVEEACFEANGYLQNVTLPASVKAINNEAFKFCPSLNSLTVNAMTPPELGWRDVFFGVDQANCRLNVPEEAVQAYMEAETWKDFFVTTGLDEISVDGNAETEWFNLLGNRVNATDLVPGNVYIRRNGTRTDKVVVK